MFFLPPVPHFLRFMFLIPTPFRPDLRAGNPGFCRAPARPRFLRERLLASRRSAGFGGGRFLRSLGAVVQGVLLFSAGLFTRAGDSAPPPSLTAHFCVTGDSRGDGKKSRINGPVAQKLVAALKAEKPDFVVVNGDLVSGRSGRLEEQLRAWRELFMAPLLEAGIPVYACRGNHDQSFGDDKPPRHETSLDVWNRVFSGRFAFPPNGPSKEKNVTYFVRRGPVLLLVMDNYAKSQSHRVNTSWMEAVLKYHHGEKPLHVFAAAHEPAFSVGHKDCLASHKRRRDKFLRLFLTAGGRCYLCGHDHFYDHAKVVLPEGEFHQFICGTAGAPLRDWKGKYRESRVRGVKHEKCFGYLDVRVRGPRATLAFKGWNDQGRLTTRDEFSYTLKTP